MALVEEADGRRLRREHNREAVLDALAAMFAEGNYQPSSNQIAERAGLSPRSLFRYFDDIDDLHHAVIARELGAALPLVELEVGPDAPTDAKIAATAEARVRVYEAAAPAARAARVWMYRQPVIGRQVRRSRLFLRQQLQELFAPELAVHADALPAMDAICSFESYDLLRSDQGLSRAATVAALVTGLTALLAPARASA